MRCGVYFNTTWRESSACSAGRCTSSLAITLAPFSVPRVLTYTCPLLRSGVTSTALMLTSAPSKLISRAIMLLSSRLTSSSTRSFRCFIDFSCHPERSEAEPKASMNLILRVYSRYLARRILSALSLRLRSQWLASQFLGDLLELVTLDYVTHLVFAEIAKPDSAFQP